MRRRDPALRRAPSLAAGVALAWRLRVLVGVLWAVHHLLVAPLWGVAVTTFGGSPAVRLDPGAAEAEWLVVAFELARPAVWPLAAAAAGTVVGWWVWTVLWRAGVVTWAVWGRAGRPRVAEILGHGVVRWWRFAGLHLVAVVLVAAVAAVAFLAFGRFGVAAAVAAHGRVLGWTVVGAVTGVASMVVVGAVVAAGCWRLGTPGVHSVLRALWQGVMVVGRHPVRAATVTLVWWVTAGLSAVGPVWAAVNGASPATVVVVLELCLAVRAACRVAFLGSFLPVLGVESEVVRSG